MPDNLNIAASCPILTIPTEVVIGFIFPNLTEPRDIAACERVCKTFQQYFSAESIWEVRLKKEFPNIDSSKIKEMCCQVQYKTAMQFILQMPKIRKRVHDLRGPNGCNGLINSKYQDLKRQGHTDDVIPNVFSFSILKQELYSCVGLDYDGTEGSISPDSKLGTILKRSQEDFLSTIISQNRQTFSSIDSKYQKFEEYIKKKVLSLRGSNGFNGKIHSTYLESAKTGNSDKFNRKKALLLKLVGENYNGNEDSISKDSILAKVNSQRKNLDSVFKSSFSKFNSNMENELKRFEEDINSLLKCLPQALSTKMISTTSSGEKVIGRWENVGTKATKDWKWNPEDQRMLGLFSGHRF